MSELQAALLAIGLGVVLAVYLFGWWKQRQYRRRFGEAFGEEQDDALYGVDQMPIESADELINVDALDDALAESAPEVELPVSTEPCVLLDARCDFIIELHLAEPGSAALLDGLWQRKFDFHKPLYVCGLTVRTGQWERVVAETQTLYAQFRIALQLLDRGGVISAAKLGDFRDLVLGIAKHINADTQLPEMQEAYREAQTFDAFCAEVDQMVGVNLLPPGNRQLNGGKIAETVALYGMKLESDGAFHLFDAAGHSLMTLANQDGSPFQHHALSQIASGGLTLMLDVPRVENPAATFDRMVQLAHALARDLQVNLVDDHRVSLTDAGLALIRARIAEVETRMRENQLEPGSAQARRIFS
jgi:hypothetical protein